MNTIAVPNIMPAVRPKTTAKTIVYPERDGKPMADNTKQFRYIATIKGGLDIVFMDTPNVLVVGDLLWYPVEGNNKLCQAPDVMVAFNRPKGDRGSYQQWKEAHIAPQVVFEILSPGNTKDEMDKKFGFYETYGVEEYYKYDPDKGNLVGWQRRGKVLEAIPVMEGWISPRLVVKFTLKGRDLRLYAPDGRPFLTFEELEKERRLAEQRANKESAYAKAESARAEAEFQKRQAESARAEAEFQKRQATENRITQIVKAMVAQGFETKMIAQLTGLSIEECMIT